jgi:hypothetical protein
VLDDPGLPSALDALAQGGALLFGESTWTLRQDGLHLAIYYRGDPDALSAHDAIRLKQQGEREARLLARTFPQYASTLANPVQTAIVWDYGTGGVALAVFDAAGAMQWYGRSSAPA